VSSGQTRDRTIARIRDGVRAWNQRRNDCHLRRFGGFNTVFLGACDVPPCPSRGDHSDDGSTIDFASPANIECEAVPGAIIVGCTSRRRIGEEVQTKVGWKNQLEEADIRFRREEGRWWIRRRTRGCSGDIRTDLWSLAAHEIGHVVGLDDLTGSDELYQTMYWFTNPCEFRKRQLGRGDYIGLKRLYTFGP
jgi:hypothetical protein